MKKKPKIKKRYAHYDDDYAYDHGILDDIAAFTRADDTYSSSSVDSILSTINVTPLIVQVTDLELKDDPSPPPPPPVSLAHTAAYSMVCGLGSDIAELTIQVARQIFVSYLLNGARTGLASQSQTLDMARKADISIEEMTIELQRTMHEICHTSAIQDAPVQSLAQFDGTRRFKSNDADYMVNVINDMQQSAVKLVVTCSGDVGAPNQQYHVDELQMNIANRVREILANALNV